MNRWLVLSSLILATAAPALHASEVAKFVHVWTSFRDSKSFVRISEHFDGKENTGGAIVLRTQPDAREGFYYSVRLTGVDHAELPAGSLVLHVILPDAQKTRTFNFPVQGGARSREFEVGITGTDWTYGKKTLPLAWKFELHDASGHVVASQESFLWKKPAAAAQ